PAGDDLGDVGQRGEGPHQPAWAARGGQDVDVPDGLLHAPQGARPGALLTAGHPRQGGDDVLGEVHGDVDGDPPTGGGHQLDAVAEVLLAAGPEPLEVTQPVLLDRLGEFVDGGDAQLVVELFGLPRPEGGDRDEFPQAGGD